VGEERVKFLRQLNHTFKEPQLKRAELPSGLLVLAEPVPQVPSVALGVWVRIGSRDEQAEHAGITHFIEHLVFKGSRRRSGYELAKRMEAIGGQIDAYTTKETTCFYARVFDGHRRRAVEILAELLSRPAFEPRLIQSEIGVVEEEIQSYEDNPEELVHDLAAEVLWSEHPLGTPILGRRETLREMSARRVREFYRSRYTAPNLVIAAAGRIDFERFCEEVEREFRLPNDPAPNGSVPLPRFRPQVRHQERDISQASVCLVRRGPSYKDRDRHALYLLNTILGAGASSRLYQTIREDAGLAYSVYSFMDSFRDTGMFGVYLGVSPDQMTRALKLVCRELRRIRKSGAHAWELESAKAQVFTGLFLSYESMYERVGRLAHNQMYYGQQVPLAEVVAAIDRITLDDIRKAAEELLDPRKYCLVTLGPAGHRKPGLEDLDF
jgi:predicted Zn-dependent peptidase